jgi:hypothetical protein
LPVTSLPAQRAGLITTGLSRAWWPVPSTPLVAARDAVIVMQARVIEALAAENTRLAGQVGPLIIRHRFVIGAWGRDMCDPGRCLTPEFRFPGDAVPVGGRQ